MRRHCTRLAGLAGMFLALAAEPARAEIVVGVVTSQTGSTSSIGIPYARGIAAAHAYIGEVGSEKIRYLLLDDASDPSNASKVTRKLIEEDKVDVLIGTAGAPATVAMVTVATEQSVP